MAGLYFQVADDAMQMDFHETLFPFLPGLQAGFKVWGENTF